MQRRRSPRRGIVLVIVVVVVAMLSLAGLSYVFTLEAEHRSILVQGEELQLEQVLASGVEYLRVFLDQPRQQLEEAGGTADNAERFRSIRLTDTASAAALQGEVYGSFSIVFPDLQSPEGVRYGLENESAKLNLAVLPQWEKRQPQAARQALLALPGMTEALADALLDWVDSDSDPRPAGAEEEAYRELGLPYGPRNTVPQCLEELLLVRGVTRDLLFGGEGYFAWASSAGDPRRSGGRSSRGPAGLAGRLPSPDVPPWASLLTVHSAERNRNYEGLPRIYLNGTDLVALGQQLQERLGPELAHFIVAYRQHGPYTGPEPTSNEPLGLDFTVPARFAIDSPLDLVGARVRVPSPDGKTGTVYASPLALDSGSLRQALPGLLDATTVEQGDVLYGRVNLNLAPREVLRAVPGMDEGLVEQIVAARATRRDAQMAHPAWPLVEGIATLPQMQAVFPYLTCGGDVYRAHIIAQDPRLRRVLRAEVVIDASVSPPRQAYWKDLRLLDLPLPPGLAEEGPQ